jgi:putative inorganic carbon (hco3(-)) transporter
MQKNWKARIVEILTKAIVINLYLFALGLFTSKALTSVSGGLICIFGLLKSVILRENPFKAIKDRTFIFSFLFFILALFLSILDARSGKTFSEIQEYITYIIFFYVAASNLSNLKQVKNLLLIALISSVISACYGTYQYYFLHLDRTFSFTQMQEFGGWLATCIIFLLVYSFWGELKIKYRLALLSGAMFLGVNLIFNQTRGAWLALLGGLVTMSWIKTKKLLIILVVMCLVLAFFLPRVYTNRFMSGFEIDNPSNLGRVGIWTGAFLMYRDHFINGVGIGRFTQELKTNYNQPNIDVYCHAHNNFLQFMAETGTIGLIAFVWLMATIIIWLYKNYSLMADSNWRLFLLASFCAVITFNIHGLTDYNFGMASTARLFWFLLVIDMTIINLSRQDAQ